MRTRTFTTCVWALLAIIMVPRPAHAITWCFDWVIYKLTNQDVDATNAASVRTVLQAKSYRKVLTFKAELVPPAEMRNQLTAKDVRISATPEPGVAKTDLAKGDVVIIGENHVGIVGDDQGHVVHFLQLPGKTGVHQEPKDAEASANFFGLDKPFWTLERFFLFERQSAQVAEDTGTPKQYQHPFLDRPIEIWRVTDSTPNMGSKVIIVKPDTLVVTGINLKAGQQVLIVAGGICTDEGGQAFGPGGQKVHHRLASVVLTPTGHWNTDLGSVANVSTTTGTEYENSNLFKAAGSPGDLLLGIMTGIDFGKSENVKGNFTVTVIGAGIQGLNTPADVVPASTPGDLGRSNAPVAFTVGCPVLVDVKDAQGRRDAMGADGKIVNDIPESSLTAKPDSAGGYEWFGELPQGEYTVTMTGTAKGTFQATSKQRGQAAFAYPRVDTDKGVVATFKLSDQGPPQPLKTGIVQEFSPTAVPGQGAPAGGPAVVTAGPPGAAGATGAAPGGVPPELSAGKNLRVARWATFRHITHFGRDPETPKFITAQKISADGSRIAFASAQGAFVIDPDGANLTQLSSKPATLIDISANGKKVAWFEGGYDGIFVANADGSDKTQMPGGLQLYSLRLTADGSRLFLLCPEKGGVFVMPSDGSDVKQVITSAAVCKMLGIDETNNLWQTIDISDDGSRVVANMTLFSVAFNADGSNPHALSDTKGVQIDGTRISANGQRTVHVRRTRETSSYLVRDFDGGNPVVFPQPWEERQSAQMTGDGSRFVTNWGVRIYDVASKTVFDPLDLGTAGSLARPCQLSMTSDMKRGSILVEGQESVAQGRSSQLMIVDFNPPTLGDAPSLAEIGLSPRFVLSDGSSTAVMSARAADPELTQVGVAPVRNGEHLADLNTWWAMNDAGQGGDEKAGDGLFSATVIIHTASGKPLEAGPVTLRLYAMNKAGNLLVVDLDGAEVRAP